MSTESNKTKALFHKKLRRRLLSKFRVAARWFPALFPPQPSWRAAFKLLLSSCIFMSWRHSPLFIWDVGVRRCGRKLLLDHHHLWCGQRGALEASYETNRESLSLSLPSLGTQGKLDHERLFLSLLRIHSPPTPLLVIREKLWYPNEFYSLLIREWLFVHPKMGVVQQVAWVI